jgi:signal transduction histidine kinase/pSer/pThr/pTyr-binding forkhead associated (FHA) protein
VKLVVLDGPLRGTAHDLDKSSHILGRKSEADLCLKGDGLISRFHCQLTAEDDGTWRLEDLGSGNGTFVGEEQVDEPRPLEPGEVLKVGGTHVAFVDDSVSAERALAGFERSSGGRLGTAAIADERKAHRREKTWTRSHQKAETTDVRVVEEEASGTRILIDGTYDPRDARALPEGHDAETLDRLRTRLSVFQDVAEAIAGKLRRRQLYEAVLEAVLKVVDAQRGFVLEVDEKAKKLRGVVVRAEGRADELVLSRTLLGKAVGERVALLVHDAQTDESLSAVDSIVRSAIRSAMAVPLIDQDEVVALIYLDTTRIGAFTQEDLELVSSVANQAALAVANARLYGQLRRAYEELESAHDSMLQNEKLSIIGTLAASIAHDIGNVLTPISGISKIVMRNPEIDERLKGAFDRQMQRLKALTRQLLSFSKPKPPELVPVEVNAQVEDSLNLVRTELRHDSVEVDLELAEDLPRVAAEASRLDQVFINLAINATHAMEKGGGGRLTVRTRREGDEVLVEFADTGCGIPEDRLKVIFEPFFTTKGSKGTGMGLFSCKRIVEEEHGGRLEVRSKLDEGTTFTIRLPALA